MTFLELVAAGIATAGAGVPAVVGLVLHHVRASERAHAEREREEDELERAAAAAERSAAEERELAKGRPAREAEMAASIPRLEVMDRDSYMNNCPYCSVISSAAVAGGHLDTGRTGIGSYALQRILDLGKPRATAEFRSKYAGPVTGVAVTTSRGVCLWQICTTCTAEWLVRVRPERAM